MNCRRSPTPRSRASAANGADSCGYSLLLHHPAGAAYWLCARLTEAAMANKEQKRSTREVKKPKQKKKGAEKFAAGKPLTAKV